MLNMSFNILFILQSITGPTFTPPRTTSAQRKKKRKDKEKLKKKRKVKPPKPPKTSPSPPVPTQLQRKPSLVETPPQLTKPAIQEGGCKVKVEVVNPPVPAAVVAPPPPGVGMVNQM